MNPWTDKHDALLNAIDGAAVVPRLYKRLAAERLEASPEFVRRARDWSASLLADPGWNVLQPGLDDPSAFPELFFDANEAGFSNRTRHHFALVFEDIVTRAIENGVYDTTISAATSMLQMWSELLETDYLADLIEELGSDLEQADKDAIVDETVVQVAQRILSGIDDPAGEQRGVVVEQVLLFYHQFLRCLETLPGNRGAGNSRAVRVASEWARAESARFRLSLAQRLERSFNDADPTSADSDEVLLDSVRWFVSVHEVIGVSNDAAAVGVGAVVDYLWGLRKVGRDEEAIFKDLVAASKPLNVALFSKIRSGALFGQNAKCADFLVFESERESNEGRRKLMLETGLEICPGHRNSAMLLSYIYIRSATETMLKIQVIPSARMLIKWGTSDVHELFADADRDIEAAEELYPFNEELDGLKERVAKEKTRLRL